MSVIRPLAGLAVVVLLLLALGRLARADPLFDHGENAREDAFVDGDLDEEDLVAMHLGGHTGTADVHGQSWVSLAGFTRQLLSGRNDVGAFVVVGLALDRVAVGPIHRIADPTHGAPRPPRSVPVPAALPPPPPPAPSPPVPPVPTPATAPQPPELVSAGFARECVNAALVASGLGTDDLRIDALIGRARASALLPETRMRAMRLWQDADHTTTVAASDTANFYDAVGANMVLELRLTWRLDRLLYAGDESTLERVRLERLDARSRIGTRTLEVLFTWEKAVLDGRDAQSGSAEERAAILRAAEARATLDVLTAGWFTGRQTPP